jgi:hypothetical protein
MKQSVLNDIVRQIANELGLATSGKEAQGKGLDSFLLLEYSYAYGGYRIVSVKIAGGAHFGALGYSSIEARMSGKEMHAALSGILQGIELAKQSLSH